MPYGGVALEHLPTKLERPGRGWFWACQECLCAWPCLEFQSAVQLKHAHPLSRPPEIRPEEASRE